MGMEYRYSPAGNYEEYASGRVLCGGRGIPNFPVRLINEIFGRAISLMKDKERVRVYDPCCGSGFSLAVLGIARQAEIVRLLGSDVDERCVEAAGKNVALITRQGLTANRDRLLGKEGLTEERRAELTASTERLLSFLGSDPPETAVFRHDILSGPPALPEAADYIFADLPYGNLTDWSSDREMPADAVAAFLTSVFAVLSRDGIVCVCGQKDLRIPAGPWRKVEKLRLGHRLAYLLERE